MKIIESLIVAALLALLFAAPADAGTVNVDAITSWAAGKPAHVRENGYGAITGSAFVGGDEIMLTRETIALVRRGNGLGLFVLLHESAHLRQRDSDYPTHLELELAADRWAMTHVRQALRRFWPHMTRQRIAAEYANAAAAPHYRNDGSS